MESVELAALAREREARNRARDPAASSLPEAWQTKPTDKPSPAQASAARHRGLPLAVVTALKGAPRSIRLARATGLALNALGICIGLFASLKWGAVTCVAGVGLAKAGGAWLHGVLPATREQKSRVRVRVRASARVRVKVRVSDPSPSVPASSVGCGGTECCLRRVAPEEFEPSAFRASRDVWVRRVRTLRLPCLPALWVVVARSAARDA